jgi:nicotinamidase-related amidase
LLLSEATVLIAIDVQRAEVLPGDHGVPVMAGGDERHDRIRRLVAAARSGGIPVVFVQEVHKPSLVDIGRELDGAEGVHCLEGDAATELAAGLEPRDDEFLIRKRRYSAFFATELELVLKSYRAESLILVGALTDVCVHYTFADAHQHDYRCLVVTDCVGGSSPAAHDAALDAMAYLQRDCRVASEEVLAALEARAHGEQARVPPAEVAA